RHGVERALARGIGNRRATAGNAGDRGDVHHRRRTARGLRPGLQKRTRGTDHLERADGVDRVDALEVFRGQAIEIMVRDMLGGAGIVDEHVDAAPALCRGRNLLAVLIARDVALHHQHLGALLAAKLGRRLGLRLAVGIVDDEARARRGEDLRGGGAESRCRPRHDRAQTVLGHLHFPCCREPDELRRWHTISRGNTSANRAGPSQIGVRALLQAGPLRIVMAADDLDT
ncbi:hypothetical protein chiPu_0030830, partial [Chiloscyllium punctatum]|nr:hypothetical protein [Chiloscyllium punctatum]